MLELIPGTSGISSKYFTNARREFPCAAISTFFPDLTVGAISECQNGRTRSRVVAKLSALIVFAPVKDAYFGSFAGSIDEPSSQSGGGMSYDRLQTLT